MVPVRCVPLVISVLALGPTLPHRAVSWEAVIFYVTVTSFDLAFGQINWKKFKFKVETDTVDYCSFLFSV